MSVTEQLLVAVFTFFELCLQNLTSYPHLFFWSKYFPWKGFLIIENKKKKIIDQNLCCIGFYFEICAN